MKTIPLEEIVDLRLTQLTKNLEGNPVINLGHSVKKNGQNITIKVIIQSHGRVKSKQVDCLPGISAMMINIPSHPVQAVESVKTAHDDDSF